MDDVDEHDRQALAAEALDLVIGRSQHMTSRPSTWSAWAKLAMRRRAGRASRRRTGPGRSRPGRGACRPRRAAARAPNYREKRRHDADRLRAPEREVSARSSCAGIPARRTSAGPAGARASSLTSGLSFSTRETVPTPTLAWRATSRMAGARSRDLGGTRSITHQRSSAVNDSSPTQGDLPWNSGKLVEPVPEQFSLYCSQAHRDREIQVAIGRASGSDGCGEMFKRGEESPVISCARRVAVYGDRRVCIPGARSRSPARGDDRRLRARGLEACTTPHLGGGGSTPLGRSGGSGCGQGRSAVDRPLRTPGAARFEESGVNLDGIVATDDPTTFARVELDGYGAANYRFYIEGTQRPGCCPRRPARRCRPGRRRSMSAGSGWPSSRRRVRSRRSYAMRARRRWCSST